MKKTLFAITTALIAFNASPGISQTRMVCGERAEFVEKLQNGYAEKPISIGLAANGSMIEIFASDHGSFSIVITKPGGSSCLVAAGDNWQNAPTRKAEAKI